jgi:hypothetical protein
VVVFLLSVPAQMTEEERLAYYQEAMKRGLESRLVPPFFTCIGKMKVGSLISANCCAFTKVLVCAAMLATIVTMMAAMVTALVMAALLTLLGLAGGLSYFLSYIEGS